MAIGRPAALFAKATAELQEVLGGLQDAVVTEAWLRLAVEGARRPVVLAAGQLVAAQRSDAERARADWRPAWKALRTPALRAWMS